MQNGFQLHLLGTYSALQYFYFAICHFKLFTTCYE